MIFAAAAFVAALTAGMGTLAMRAIARKYNIAITRASEGSTPNQYRAQAASPLQVRSR